DLPLPRIADWLLDELMHVGLQLTHVAFMVSLFFSHFGLILVPLALLAFYWRPSWFVRREEEKRFATAPWLYSFLCGGLTLGQVGMDLNPWVALGCAGSAALAVVRWHRAVTAAVVVAAFVAGWAALSPTDADAAAIVMWSGILALLALLHHRWMVGRDVFLVGAVLSVIVQLAAASFPLYWPSHGGALLGDGMAYGFCENVSRGRLYAAVSGSASDRFRTGHILEYDSARLTQLRDLKFFDEEFSGRFVQLLCLPDTIQVAMAQTWISGRPQDENVMEFRIDDPRDVKRSLWGEGMGQQLLWDDKRDAVFYASEWNNEIFRLDRRTGEVNRSVSAGAIPEQPQWLYRKVTGSFGIAPMPHHGRDSMFVARWLTGSTVYEIDLETLTLRRQLEPRSGCIGALAVDEQYDRLFTASLWGVDVIDLRTGRVERRMRTGTGPRTPVIDTQNGLVYVPTTADGRLRAFDRETLRPAGILPLGG